MKDNDSRYSRGLVFLCCLAGFCGFAGIHNFLVGKIGWGILFFLTGGLFGIGTVVDLIKIWSGIFEDSSGKAVVL